MIFDTTINGKTHIIQEIVTTQEGKRDVSQQNNAQFELVILWTSLNLCLRYTAHL